MMNRNKFFSVVGLGMIGVLMSKIIPLRFTSGKKVNAKKVSVKINPLAVKREKVIGKNV
jgi:hypothetical protein